MFTGPAEAVETYIDGNRKNMSNRRRKELAEAGAGRGRFGKAAVAGVKDKENNRIVARRVSQTDTGALLGFVPDHAAPGATPCTDGAAAYRGMPEYDHVAVNHCANEFVRQAAHTNGMEGFWAGLKRGIAGTFHEVSDKRLDRYVAEFGGCHKIRSRDNLDMMRSIAGRMAGKRLRYRDLIAPNGLPFGARPLV